MDWSNLYRAPQRSKWKGRTDGPGAERYHEIVELIDLRKGIPSIKNPATFGLIGFASDLGIERNKGRLGAKQGPEALRKLLGPMPAPDPSKVTFYDLGDLVCERDLEHAQASLGIIVAMLLAQGVRPIVIGGGHEVAWGNYQGIATFNPKLNIPIINFDAHYDLRPLEDNLGTSGTSFTQIYLSTQQRKLPFNYTVVGLQPQSNTRALHAFAKDLNVTTITAEQIATNPLLHQTLNLKPNSLEGELLTYLDTPRHKNEAPIDLDKGSHKNEAPANIHKDSHKSEASNVHRDLHKSESPTNIQKESFKSEAPIYLSVCLDVFGAPFAPGVSAPQSLGLVPVSVLPLFRTLASHALSFDIAELSPTYDIDNRTASLAASLVSIYIESNTHLNISFIS